jgi:hypothetical protein
VKWGPQVLSPFFNYDPPRLHRGASDSEQFVVGRHTDEIIVLGQFQWLGGELTV